MYNLTNYTSAVGIHNQVAELNILSGGVLGICLLVSVFLIVLISMKKYEKDFKDSWVASSLIAALIGVPMIAMNFIYWPFYIIVLLNGFASLMVYFFTD